MEWKLKKHGQLQPGGGMNDDRQAQSSTYIMLQSLNLQAELRGGGVSQLQGEAQVWELHTATDEEHWVRRSWQVEEEIWDRCTVWGRGVRRETTQKKKPWQACTHVLSGGESVQQQRRRGRQAEDLTTISSMNSKLAPPPPVCPPGPQASWGGSVTVWTSHFPFRHHSNIIPACLLSSSDYQFYHKGRNDA